MRGNDVGEDLCYAKVAVIEGGTEVEALGCLVGAKVLHVAVFSVDQLTPDKIWDMDSGVPVGCWGCVGGGSKFKWRLVEKIGGWMGWDAGVGPNGRGIVVTV